MNQFSTDAIHIIIIPYTEFSVSLNEALPIYIKFSKIFYKIKNFHSVYRSFVMITEF